tara:strand:- start:499 stop:888 length:390 start_codon:yes stop_codon:yes gene_type:complete
MRRIFNLFNFILFISITCNSTICAQKGALFVKKDSLISKVVELNKKINLEIYEKDYYVIQLYYGDYEIAQNVLKEFSTNFPDWQTFLIFETPNYKVRVGKFKKILKAQSELDKVKKIYPSAFILMPNNL